VARELSGDLNGGRFGFQTEPQRYNGQDVHMTVMSPTLLQTTDSDFVLNINMRQTYGLTRACIEDAFNEKAACYGFSYKIIEYKDFLAVPSDRPFLQRMASSYEYETGRANAFITAHGTSYAKAMPYFVAWGPYFPEDCDSCHEADENIKIATLESAYRVYARALFNMVFDEENLK
jgi:predicted CxxxxCH...CXXCH cytochrome family protein